MFYLKVEKGNIVIIVILSKIFYKIEIIFLFVKIRLNELFTHVIEGYRNLSVIYPITIFAFLSFLEKYILKVL